MEEEEHVAENIHVLIKDKIRVIVVEIELARDIKDNKLLVCY